MQSVMAALLYRYARRAKLSSNLLRRNQPSQNILSEDFAGHAVRRLWRFPAEMRAKKR